MKQYVSFPEEIIKARCQKFESWIKINEIDSVSFIFASGYFKNPASFYGHPLLRFNSKKNTQGNLLDLTLNNGADVPNGENPISYVIKGIFGGYRSAFSDTRFYRLNHNYSETDLRDLWEYELNLGKREISKLAYLSWELLEQRFTYQFFSKNCGYFLEGLIEYALGERISPINKFYAIPSVTFFNLMETKFNGGPLVRKIVRTPSRQNRFVEKYLALSNQKKKRVYQLSSKMSYDGSKKNITIGIIDTLVDYLQFLSIKELPPDKILKIKRFRSQLLLARLEKFGSWKEFQSVSSSSLPPHLGSRPSKWEIGYLNNQTLGSGIVFSFRPAANDLTDIMGGHVPYSVLNMFDLEIVTHDGKATLSKLDIVNIYSPNTSRTRLPYDGGLAWGLRLGFERADKSCTSCVVSQITGLTGKARQFGEHSMIAAEIQSRYHSTYKGRNLEIGAGF